jgi:hypothetical protein
VAKSTNSVEIDPKGHLVHKLSQAFTTSSHWYGLPRKALLGRQRPRSIGVPDVWSTKNVRTIRSNSFSRIPAAWGADEMDVGEHDVDWHVRFTHSDRFFAARGLDNGITGFPQMFCHVASDEDLVLDHKNDRSTGTVGTWCRHDRSLYLPS